MNSKKKIREFVLLEKSTPRKKCFHKIGPIMMPKTIGYMISTIMRVRVFCTNHAKGRLQIQ